MRWRCWSRFQHCDVSFHKLNYYPSLKCIPVYSVFLCAGNWLCRGLAGGHSAWQAARHSCSKRKHFGCDRLKCSVSSSSICSHIRGDLLYHRNFKFLLKPCRHAGPIQWIEGLFSAFNLLLSSRYRDAAIVKLRSSV